MNNQNVIHAEVIQTIDAVLEAHGVAEREREQAVAEVIARVIEAVEGRRAPKILRDWQILAAKTAAAWAVQERGLASVEGLQFPVSKETEEDEGDRQMAYIFFDDPRSPGETRNQIAVLLDMLDRGDMPDQGREILARLGDGEKADSIAGALGLTEADVRARLHQMRTRFFRRQVAVERFKLALLSEAEGDVEDESELEPQSR